MPVQNKIISCYLFSSLSFIFRFIISQIYSFWLIFILQYDRWKFLLLGLTFIAYHPIFTVPMNAIILLNNYLPFLGIENHILNLFANDFFCSCTKNISFK